MKDTEIIEKYFNRLLSEEEKTLFENQLRADSTLLTEVAHYIQLQDALRNECLTNRHKEWSEFRKKGISFKSLISIAAVLAVFLGGIWYWYFSSPLDLEGYAELYVQQDLQTRNIQMNSSKDSFQQAINLYNQGRLEDASNAIEKLLVLQPDNAEQLELSGITYLRLGKYEEALSRFREMEKLDLYDNTSVFYQAVTLLKRKSPLDVQEAEKLLKKVSNERLGGYKYAQEWLKTN